MFIMVALYKVYTDSHWIYMNVGYEAEDGENIKIEILRLNHNLLTLFFKYFKKPRRTPNIYMFTHF